MGLGLVSGFGWGSLSEAEPLPLPELRDIAREITVRIDSPEDELSGGSGLVARREGNKYIILTACHVLDVSGIYTVNLFNGHSYDSHEINVQRPNSCEGLDLASLEFFSDSDYQVADPSDIEELYELITNEVFVGGFPDINGFGQARSFHFEGGGRVIRI
jgi:hypothetical protein